MEENIPLYWSAPYQKQILAKITAVEGDSIRLNQNLFYPGGGGQLSDTGYLKHLDKEIKIQRVYKEDNEIWHELEKGNTEELEIGKEVLLEIDWMKRYSFMKAHTAQHLISYLLKKRFNSETDKANFEEERIDIEISKKISLEDLIKIIKEANQMIENGLEVKSIIIDQQTYREKYLEKIRGKISDEENVRLIQLGEEGYDLTSCGGIHVKNISEIKGVYLENLKNRSIKLLVDSRGIKYATSQRKIMIQLEKITAKKEEKLIEIVQNKLEENEILQNGNINLLKLILANIAGYSEKINDKTAAFLNLPEVDRQTIQTSAKELASDAFVILLGKNNVVYFISSSDAILASEVLDKLKKESDVKGGGNERFAQAYVKDIEKPLNIVRKIIKEM